MAIQVRPSVPRHLAIRRNGDTLVVVAVAVAVRGRPHVLAPNNQQRDGHHTASIPPTALSERVPLSRNAIKAGPLSITIRPSFLPARVLEWAIHSCCLTSTL